MLKFRVDDSSLALRASLVIDPDGDLVLRLHDGESIWDIVAITSGGVLFRFEDAYPPGLKVDKRGRIQVVK